MTDRKKCLHRVAGVRPARSGATSFATRTREIREVMHNARNRYALDSEHLKPIHGSRAMCADGRPNRSRDPRGFSRYQLFGHVRMREVVKHARYRSARIPRNSANRKKCVHRVPAVTSSFRRDPCLPADLAKLARLCRIHVVVVPQNPRVAGTCTDSAQCVPVSRPGRPRRSLNPRGFSRI